MAESQKLSTAPRAVSADAGVWDWLPTTATSARTASAAANVAMTVCTQRIKLVAMLHRKMPKMFTDADENKQARWRDIGLSLGWQKAPGTPWLRSQLAK